MTGINEPAASGENVAWPRHEAQALLDNLNARIDAAVEGGGDSVPVFPGIAALHASLSAPSPVGVDRESAAAGLKHVADALREVHALGRDGVNDAAFDASMLGQIAACERGAALLLTPQPSDRERVLEEALAWYGEQARLARLIHSEGDAGRHALAEDGGKRARALSTPQTEAEA